MITKSAKLGGGVLLLSCFVFIMSAGAFPTWMGICCGYDRHDGGNPGTFTILMNEDYWGLECEVGMQTTGVEWNSNWETHPMVYSGNTSGNSIWQFTPSWTWPSGATVTYYFHGWTYGCGDIYDSNGGWNYQFTL